MSFSFVAAAVVSLLPISSVAMVFWDDELEPGSTGYSTLLETGPCGGVPSFEYDTSIKVSGAASLKENFPGTPQYHQLCGGFADRTFPPTDDLWTRFYIRLSPGFVVDYVATKVMRNDWTDPRLSGWWVMMFGSPMLSLSLQNYPTAGASTTLGPNVGNGTLPSGQFVCIETHIKNNTVGSADGVVEAWKDGIQFMSYPGLSIRRTGDFSENLLLNSNRIYRQDGGGSINYDRLAIGNGRIGCLHSVPSSDQRSER